MTFALCPNCESDRHARCCSWCGKVHKPARLQNAQCSAKCEKETARADKLSDAMEEAQLEIEEDDTVEIPHG